MPNSQLKLEMTVEETQSANWLRLTCGKIKWNVPAGEMPEGWAVGDTIIITGTKKVKR